MQGEREISFCICLPLCEKPRASNQQWTKSPAAAAAAAVVIRCGRWHVYGCGANFGGLAEEDRREGWNRFGVFASRVRGGDALSLLPLSVPHPFRDCARTFSTGNCQIECRVRPPMILLGETASRRSIGALGQCKRALCRG